MYAAHVSISALRQTFLFAFASNRPTSHRVYCRRLSIMMVSSCLDVFLSQQSCIIRSRTCHNGKQMTHYHTILRVGWIYFYNKFLIVKFQHAVVTGGTFSFIMIIYFLLLSQFDFLVIPNFGHHLSFRNLSTLNYIHQYWSVLFQIKLIQGWPIDILVLEHKLKMKKTQGSISRPP